MMTRILSREGGGALGIQILFQSRGAGGDAFWIRYLGGKPPHGKGRGGVSGPSGDTDDGAAPAEETGQEVNVHLGCSRTWSHITSLLDHC